MAGHLISPLVSSCTCLLFPALFPDSLPRRHLFTSSALSLNVLRWREGQGQVGMLGEGRRRGRGRSGWRLLAGAVSSSAAAGAHGPVFES